MLRKRRGASRTSLALVAVALLALALPPLAGAKNEWFVSSRILPSALKLTAKYYIQRPADCPKYEPRFDDPGYDAWTSDRCQDYVDQHADFVLTVTHNGRRVYADSGQGYGTSDAWRGATFTKYLYVLQLANCDGRGAYFWKLTLLDPYNRYGYSLSERGTFICR